MLPIPIQTLLLVITTLYQAIGCWRADQSPPPGQRFDVGGHRLHLYAVGNHQSDQPTIVLDHSLGGIEGYLLIEILSKLTRTCIYDRAGYGWSDRSRAPRTSEAIVAELDALLTQAAIEPPYLLIGDSFGSYNVRLYTHQFSQKVVGMVLTDGLHERTMLQLPWSLRALKLLFVSGFVMSVLGALLGLVRLLSDCGVFELLKPELRHFSQPMLATVKRSFCHPQHWITMAREMLALDQSGRQVQMAQDLGSIPIVSIKAQSFFKPSFWTRFIPLRRANQVRDLMHHDLAQLSPNWVEFQAHQSGHFVWVDQPKMIVEAVQILLAHTSTPRAIQLEGIDYRK